MFIFGVSLSQTCTCTYILWYRRIERTRSSRVTESRDLMTSMMVMMLGASSFLLVVSKLDVCLREFKVP